MPAYERHREPSFRPRPRGLVHRQGPAARQHAGHSARRFLLQLAKDLAPAIAKRLSMYVLRSKVKIADESDAWAQYGVWDSAQGLRRRLGRRCRDRSRG